jgi:hypothetical protein
MGAIGGVIGGIASIAGGRQERKAASGAARAQERAQQAAIAEQRRQFELTRQQLDPFRQAGLGALNMQLALMGLPQVGAAPTGLGGQISDLEQQIAAAQGGQVGGVPGAFAQQFAQPTDVFGLQSQLEALRGQQPGLPQFTREQALASLQATPGQQFLRERQQQALLRQQAALGGLGGGQVRTALQQQAMGFAQQDLQNQLARLAGLAGAGQQAAAGIGQFGQAAAGQIGQGLVGAGQARASGILGAQQARAGQLEQGMGLLGTVAAPFLGGF